MTEYQKRRQQVLKTREDTICFTREEVQTIIDLLKEARAAMDRDKQKSRIKAFRKAYKQYQSLRSRRFKSLSDGKGIELIIQAG